MKSADYRSRRLVLKHQRAEAEVQQFADELGWPRITEEPGDAERGRAYEVVWAAGPAISLHYLEDPLSQHSYVVAWGGDREIVKGLVLLASERLDTWGIDELLSAIDAAQDPMDLAVAVIRAGVGSPHEFDERFFRQIEASMSHRDRRVREAALYSTLYAQWPQYRPLLEESAANDPDEDLRADARELIEVFDAREGEP